MDQNYRLSPLDLSLKMLCAIKLVCAVAEAADRKCLPDRTACRGGEEVNEFKKVLMKTVANMKVRLLKCGLPPSVVDFLQNIAMPIAKEMILWDHKCCTSRPIWTCHGQVDVVKSIMAILKNAKAKVSNCQRFRLASLICHEDSILDIYLQLSRKEISLIRGGRNDVSSFSSSFNKDPLLMLPEFWISVCQGEFGQLEYGWQFPARAYDPGLKVAMSTRGGHSDFAIHFFLDMLGLNWISLNRYYIKLYRHNVRIVVDSITGYYPATICRLFLLQNRHWELLETPSVFPSLLLLSLLDWPYQRFFLQAAQVLIVDLESYGYFNVMLKLLQRMAEGYMDWDYKMLFFGFWELRITERQISLLKSECRVDVTRSVFKTDDADILEFCLGKLTAEESEALLRDFVCHSIWDEMIQRRQFRLFEIFVGKCGANRVAQLLKLKVVISVQCQDSVHKTRFTEILDERLTELRSDAVAV